MPNNTYEQPDFARNYVTSQVDRSKNRYEWDVTHPATLQFLDSSVNRVLDYGCGSGIFTAGIVQNGRQQHAQSFEAVGTDASEEMLRYAAMLGSKVEGLSFQQWNAGSEDSALQNRGFDRVFAKLVLNYISEPHLREAVIPRLRESLSDEGLLVAVLPNPLREAGYSASRNKSMNELEINVGGFSVEATVQSYHHTYEQIFGAAENAGFTFGKVLGLPEVRFEPYKRKLMKIAHPMPMIFDTLNAAKRWVYVFGATEASAKHFDNAVTRFEAWRTQQYPEIADRVHIRLPTHAHNEDIVLPLNLPHDALYDYVDTSNLGGKRVVTIEGDYAEHMTPKQKIKTVRELSRQGVRDAMDMQAFLMPI